ncbi:hypothetical protein BH77_32280 [Pseudomonas aeruginosa C2773C]|nr:hypothetical protein BH77_32280 [Pseudomonas aeruginosa C2773C]
MPVPQELDFSDWPTMKGGTLNQRQISSTLNARDSRSWASLGLIPMVLASMPPSSRGDLPALMAPLTSARLSRNSVRCSLFRTRCMVNATVGARPFSNVLLAAFPAARADPKTCDPYSIADSPQSPSMVKPGIRKMFFAGISRCFPFFSVYRYFLFPLMSRVMERRPGARKSIDTMRLPM